MTIRVSRALLVACGVCALLLALFAAAGTVLPTAALVSLFGNDYFLVAALGVLALAVAAPVAASGRAANLRQREMPTPERPATAVPAGSSFDAACARWRLQIPVYGADDRLRLRERLRSAAVETARRDSGLDREAARAAVADGTWWDDEVAAAFLAGDHLPAGAWTRALAAGDPPFGHAARRAANEIVRRYDDRGGER